jgi:hypothetical protein
MASVVKPDGKCPRCGESVFVVHTGDVVAGGLERVALDPRAKCYWLHGEPGDYTGNEAVAYVEHSAVCRPKEGR